MLCPILSTGSRNTYMSKGNKRLPNKIISRIVLGILRWYLSTIFFLKLERNDTLKMTPPYLLIGNHANFWDGFLVNLFIKEPICFLVSDEYFRTPLFKMLLQIEGSIPKKKFMTDLAAVKEALRAKEAGRIIGVFPEGMRNWDGSVGELIFATAKFIKMLNIPVVRVLSKGSYLSFPRWAHYKRKGKIIFDYELIMMAEQIKEMSIDEIFRKINDSLSYNEYDYQRKTMNTYQGKNLAERLELYLYLCPNCQQIGTLTSRDDVLFCGKCGYQVKYNVYGFFTNGKERLYFDNPADWNRWQVNYTKSLLKTYQESNYTGIFIQEKDVNCQMVDHFKKLEPWKDGQLLWQGKSILFHKNGKEYLNFELEHIKGINVQYNNRFDFYHKEQLYQFYFNCDSISAYKWETMIKLAQQIFF